MKPKVYIEQDDLFYNKVKWVVFLISQYTSVTYDFVEQKENPDIRIGTLSNNDIQINILFFDKLQNGITKWQDILPIGPIYIDEKGKECLLESIFYLVNCIQELNVEESDFDQWGRFKFTSSLQYHYGLIETNFVSQLMDKIIQMFPILLGGKSKPKRPSKIFLSHDIDMIHSGWKIEGYLALTSFNFSLLSKVFKGIISKKPFYNNIQQVIDKDKSYGFKSCFYWLPSLGKDNNGIMNADYSLSDMKQMILEVESQGFACGIHKSSFNTELEEESLRFDHPIEHNRYHFLKFQTHEAWKKIEQAGLKTDSSLGFAEHIGFRNSYGLPFVPFDMENDKPFSFVEIPLHVMDITLYKYMDISPDEMQNTINQFFAKNSHNSLISILWHNNMMTDYTYISLNKLYNYLLQSFREKNYNTLLPDEIYGEYIG